MSPGTPNESPRIRVLVVEDNEDDQELLLRQLRRVNFHEQVLFVPSGSKALELLTTANAEVTVSEVFAVFLDLNLPGMGGVEFLRRLRAEPATARMPVVVMTGSMDARDRVECERLKVLQYLVKPVTFATFSMAVAGIFHLPPGNGRARSGLTPE